MDGNNMNTPPVNQNNQAPNYNNVNAAYNAAAPVYVVAPQKPSVPHSGKSTAAMVLGIISLFLCLGPASFICSIIATVLGSIAYKKSGKQLGKAGMTMGIIALVLWALVIIAYIVIFIILPALGFAGLTGLSIWGLNEAMEYDMQQLMDPSYYNYY